MYLYIKVFRFVILEKLSTRRCVRYFTKVIELSSFYLLLYVYVLYDSWVSLDILVSIKS